MTLQMSDSISEHVLFFLQQLPKKDFKIIELQSDEVKCQDEVKLALSQIKAGETRDSKAYFERKKEALERLC
jgi:hypothetical protein